MTQHSFLYKIDAAIICCIMLLLMAVMVYVGYHLRRIRKYDYEGIGPIEGSSFALLGLLLAFTFGMSANRFEDRRKILVEERNNLADVILRIDTFDNDSLKNALSIDFKQLLDQRIQANAIKVFDPRYDTILTTSYGYVRTLIKHSTELAKDPKYNFAALQLIQALIKVNDSITIRHSAITATVPDPIVWLLILFALSCSIITGFSLPVSKKINWLPVVSFVLFTCIVIFIILELDRPNRGLINNNRQYKLIEDIRQMLFIPR